MRPILLVLFSILLSACQAPQELAANVQAPQGPTTPASVPCTTIGGYVAKFSGGSGTDADPYRIGTVSDLSYVWVCPSASFELVDNVVGPYPTVDVTPLGAVGFTFSGHFNGNGYTISNFFLQAGGSQNNVGLFGVNTGTIENLNLQQVIVQGGNSVGTLVGLNQGTISNVYANASDATGTQDVGGLVGLDSGSITASSAMNGTVYGSLNVGGVVGSGPVASMSSLNSNDMLQGPAPGPVNASQIVGLAL